MDFAWCHDAARALAEAVMGVLDFDLGNEVQLAAVQAVHQAACDQLRALARTEVESQGDSPF